MEDYKGRGLQGWGITRVGDYKDGGESRADPPSKYRVLVVQVTA